MSGENEFKGYSANVGVDINFSKKLYASVRIAGSYNKTDSFNLVNPYSYASSTNRGYIVIKSRWLFILFTRIWVVTYSIS